MPSEYQAESAVKLSGGKVPGGLNRGKIDDTTLHRLLAEERKSQKEAAAFFGVTEAAVSKRVKALKLNLSRHVGLERAKVVADRGLDVVDQLQKINRAIQEELQWALTEARKPGVDRRSLQQVIVDHTGEVRKQLHFQLEMLRSLADWQAVAEFQQEVLDGIGEVAPEVREQIVRRLQERRALRTAIDFPSPRR